MSKIDPKMGAQTRSFFGYLAPFFCARRPWEPKWLPSFPQEPPRPVHASISIDFELILDHFLMIFCIMWATFYLVCLITFLVILRLFSVPDGLGSPNGSQASPKSPQDQSKPRFPSILGWFWTIFLWFSVLPHHFFGYLELTFSNFWPQVQMCWGRP